MFYGINYSAADYEPRRDRELIQWTVNRLESIGVLFSRIKKQLIHFPRVEDCGTFLDEFAAAVSSWSASANFFRPAKNEAGGSCCSRQNAATDKLHSSCRRMTSRQDCHRSKIRRVAITRLNCRAHPLVACFPSRLHTCL